MTLTHQADLKQPELINTDSSDCLCPIRRSIQTEVVREQEPGCVRTGREGDEMVVFLERCLVPTLDNRTVVYPHTVTASWGVDMRQRRHAAGLWAHIKQQLDV